MQDETPTNASSASSFHAEPVVVADGTNEFTRDRALIELYRDKIRLEEHAHGKQGLLYIGMFPIFLSCLPWPVIVPEFQLKLTKYYIPRRWQPLAV